MLMPFRNVASLMGKLLPDLCTADNLNLFCLITNDIVTFVYRSCFLFFSLGHPKFFSPTESCTETPGSYYIMFRISSSLNEIFKNEVKRILRSRVLIVDMPFWPLWDHSIEMICPWPTLIPESSPCPNLFCYRKESGKIKF